VFCFKSSETKKIKEIQSINLILMKSRAKQSVLRIKNNMEKVKKVGKGTKQDLGKETKIRAPAPVESPISVVGESP
jgi:hypothetical protein